MPDVHVFA